MTDPLISVIIPCYNQEKYLDDCINSVIDQTYHHWEVIIINDGSSDSTEDTALKWTKKDSRINYIGQENGGVSNARNTGLKIAKGDYIQFLDSDDFIHPEKFKKTVEFINQFNPDIILSNFIYTDKKGNINNGYEKYNVKEKILDYNCLYILNKFNSGIQMPPVCYIIKSSLIGDALFNEELKAYEDSMFFFDIVYNKKVSFSHIHETLNYYRIHGENTTIKDYYKMRDNQSIFYNILISKYPKFTSEIIKKLVEKEIQLSENIYIINNGKRTLLYYVKLLAKKTKNILLRK